MIRKSLHPRTNLKRKPSVWRTRRNSPLTALVACLTLLSVGSAQADVYVWATESGGSTTFNFTGLLSGPSGVPSVANTTSALAAPNLGFLVFRAPDVNGGAGLPLFNVTQSGVPGTYGTGGVAQTTTSTSGDRFLVNLLPGSPGQFRFGSEVYGSEMSGSMSFNNTLAGLGVDTTPIILTLPNGERIFLFYDGGAINQLARSALPFHLSLGQIGLNVAQGSSRDFGQRLFRNRTRYVPRNGAVSGASTSVGDFFNGRGREVAASRYEKLSGRLTGDTLAGGSTISLSPRASGAAEASSLTPAEKSGTVIHSNQSPFLSVDVPAGESISGALASGKNWILWGSTDYGNIELDALGPATPGVESDSYTSSIGFEYAVNDSLSIGLGWSHLWNDNTLNGGLGSVDVDGDAAVTYLTWFKNNFWADLLYSYGSHEMDLRRNTGLGTTVQAAPDLEMHQASLNLGYNLGHDDGRVVHGPTFAMDYVDGSIDAYTETGDPRSNTAFGSQDFESLITRIGWQVNWQQESTLGLLRPQVRIGYGRENLNREQNINATLVPNVANSNTAFGIGGSTADPGEGWMELGVGIGVEVSDNCRLLFDYETQIFRENASVHYGSAMVRVKF